jgi:hypothetical protein
MLLGGSGYEGIQLRVELRLGWTFAANHLAVPATAPASAASAAALAPVFARCSRRRARTRLSVLALGFRGGFGMGLFILFMIGGKRLGAPFA